METQVRTRVSRDGGEMVPAALRSELGLTAGDELVVSRDRDGIHVRTRPIASAGRAGLVARYIPVDADLVAELRLARRADASPCRSGRGPAGCVRRRGRGRSGTIQAAEQG
jgi:AbrB family looped-hinge helix DNA binding protein